LDDAGNQPNGDKQCASKEDYAKDHPNRTLNAQRPTLNSE
jgi:hypothetical protein